jgi:hypothetical protein
MERLTEFSEVFAWIVYDWGDWGYTLEKDSKGCFYINKLYISPTHLCYKTETYEIAPSLYRKVNQLYNLFQETKLDKLFDETKEA